jgi:hypothetical protein
MPLLFWELELGVSGMQVFRVLVLGISLFSAQSALASIDAIITRVLAASRGPQWHCSDSVEDFGVKQTTKNALEIRTENETELFVLDELVYSGADRIESVQVYTPDSSPEWVHEDESEDGIGLILLINGRHIRAFTDSGRIGRGTYDRTTLELSMNFAAQEETNWESMMRQIAAFEARPLHVRQKMGYKGG